VKAASLGSPRIPRWVLTKLSVWVERQSLLDDLELEFEAKAAEGYVRNARTWFWTETLRAIPSIVRYAVFRSLVMIGNYAKIALRSIRRQKVFSFINIFGLAVGIALSLYVMRLVVSIGGSDGFHENKDRTYRLISTLTSGDRRAELATAPFPLAEALRRRSEVESVVRIKKNFGGPAVIDDKTLPVRGYYVDRDFFKLFSFRLEAGDPGTALAEPFSLVLAKTLAEKLFGPENPVGRTLSLKGTGDFRITGIMADASQLRSHMDFECLASLETLASLEKTGAVPALLENWDGFYETYVYFLLRENAVIDGLVEALPDLARGRYPERPVPPGFEIQALTEISPGRNLGNFLSTPAVSPRTPLLLGSIALLLVVVACFNYANLSLAKAFNRAKEVGIRKVVGANRKRLVAQFVGEAVTISLVALVLALFLGEFVIPRFFEPMPFISVETAPSSPFSVPAAVLLAILVGILAGIVPAVLFSKFKPAVVLRDVTQARLFSRLTLRQGLAVFQFFVSFLFIITTLVIFKQIRHVEGADKGFQAENILNVDLGEVDYDLFRQEISSHPAVAGISATDAILCTGNRGIMEVRSPENGEDREIDVLAVDERFLEIHGIRLLAGRSFPAGASGGGERFAIINEKAVAALRFASPQDAVGNPLVLKSGRSLEIVGVTKNFISQSLDGEVRPLVLRVIPRYLGYANIRLKPGDPGPFLDFLAEKWKALEPYRPLTYGFLEEQIDAYQEEGHSLLRAVSYIAFLSVMITFFGLLGMVVYDMDARVKEIGIRKVLGASVTGIAFALSRRFIVLLALGAALATPAAWILNGLFLQASANRIRLGPGIFGLGILFMLALGLATVLSQTVRAAAGNPVDSLRNE
jgi:putative ABC transport system permease protein